MCADKPQETAAEEESKSVELSPAQSQTVAPKISEAEVETLKFGQLRRVNPVLISTVLIFVGALSLALSIVHNSQVLAFIGLGLTFWGALFLFVRPIRYVESILLDSAVTPAYATIDRIMKDFKQKGKSYHIPPYPTEVYLPEHLKGLKEMIVCISSESNFTAPPLEDLAAGKFLLENQKGICISAPGASLLSQFEKELRADITKLEFSELCESLSQIIPERLQLAKEIEVKSEDKQIYLRISDSVYKRLYASENLKSVRLIGCPLVSAIACAIAKNTGKMVSIQKDRLSPDQQFIEVWYRLVSE